MGVPCGLLIYLPGEWEADPTALAELRRFLGDEYGVTLQLEPAATPLLAPVAIRLGVLAQHAEDPALRARINAAFFTLDWLEFEDVS
ncbi:hypothetical protein [Deinococcus rufus]|uniref:Uncharacterized protein n=1 Tax=Deinococcus rufus TaxID=2136097 RepID=A0ABV7Z7K0_9DEIO